ncbi:MAG: hypothetical protein QF886_08475, partial [Planctomycetota bacterium]|nr:hypothetical protein [Planctomycetota bacterium]
MNFATILALCGGLTLAEEVELIWQAGGNKTSQTGLENYIPVTRKAGQSWRILIKGKFIQRDADRFRLRIRASDETILNQFAIAEQEPKDERNVVNGTWTPIKFNGGSSSLPLLGMKRAVSDVVEFSLRKGKDYSITFFARVDAQCVYQPPPGIINSYVIRGDYRGEAQWAKMIAKGMGKGFRGIGYDLDLCRDAAVPGWQATAQVSIPKSRRLEPMTIPDGKVRFDLKRLRKERRDAVDAKTRAHLKERVQSEFNHFNYHADPRLFDPGAKVPENRTYSIKAELKSHRSYSRYVGTLLDTEDPAKIERAGKILTAMSTLPEWVEKSPLASHYSLLPILRTYPTRRHLLKKEARENYEAMLRKLFTQNPQGNYKASVDDSSVTLNSGSRIYRDAATCSILGQMLEMPETLEYGLGAVARIRRIADAYPISQYNNQMYGQFFIESMAMMIQHVDHWPSVVSAMLLEERAFMTQALMFHHPTRSHTGPETGRPATALLRYFSKAYPPALETYGIEALDTVDFGTLPDYLAALTENNVNPMTARFTATANTLRQVDVVVHKTSEYSMASQSEPDSLAAPQRYNHTSECQPELHYRRADNSVGRIVLRASEQTEVEWISDYGQFFGLQHGSKLIGFYSSYYPHWTIQGKKTVPREPARIIGTSFFVPESMELFIGSEKALINVALDQPSEFQSGDMVFGREAGTYFALRILETGRMAE